MRKEVMMMNNPITPDHYDMAIPPIEYIEKNHIPFAEGNVIKYISRFAKKNGKEDLLKAKKYIELILKYRYPDEQEK